MRRIIELKWTCNECSTRDILGRHKRCPSCGSPREKGEMQMGGLGRDDYHNDGRNKAATVTDPDLLKLAQEGPDWFCQYCGAGNRNSSRRCNGLAGETGCGAPREENEPQRFETDPPTPAPTPSLPRRMPRSQARRPLPEDPIDTYFKGRKASRERTLYFALGGLGVFLLATVAFFVWAFQTHEVEGRVTSMTWEQSTILQRWTPVVVRQWRHQTRQVREVEPRDGRGERAGMALIPGTCRSEHYDNESYPCGTDRVCTPKYRTESYACGETCSSNGNGFATCSTRYCTRQVSDGQTCRDETRYCSRPIYKDRCDYQTQEWRTVKTVPARGEGRNTLWPDVAVGRLDRLRYAANYSVGISYTDRGTDETYEVQPGDTSFLGMTKALTATQARKAEAAYREWSVGQRVTLEITNLGGVNRVVQ